MCDFSSVLNPTLFFPRIHPGCPTHGRAPCLAGSILFQRRLDDTQASSSDPGWLSRTALCPIRVLWHVQLLFPASACRVANGCCGSAPQMGPLECILFAMHPIPLPLVMLGDAFSFFVVIRIMSCLGSGTETLSL